MPIVNNTTPHVTLYTDGSWKKSYNAGGWACLMVCGPYWKVIADGDSDITVNRAELTAMLRGLQALTCPCTVDIISDSMYSVNCINKWIAAWEANGWRNLGGDPVANQDLIIQLRNMMYIHQVKAYWVKSHTTKKGEKYLGNATVDAFAQLGSSGVLNR